MHGHRTLWGVNVPSWEGVNIQGGIQVCNYQTHKDLDLGIMYSVLGISKTTVIDKKNM